MAEQGFEFNENWQAWCLLCKKSLERPYRTDNALCTFCMNRYRNEAFFSPIVESELASSFVTIIPEAKSIPEELVQYGCRDLLLRFRGRLKEPKNVLEKLFRARLHIPCGQPALFEMEHLARFSGLGATWVLDMSPYTWSGTHKDLRSWAILSQAIEHDVQHIALWTAGNAGLGGKLRPRYYGEGRKRILRGQHPGLPLKMKKAYHRGTPYFFALQAGRLSLASRCFFASCCCLHLSSNVMRLFPKFLVKKSLR